MSTKPRRVVVVDELAVRTMIQAAINDAGGVRALARQWGLTPSYITDLRLGRRAPSEEVCRRVCVRKVVEVRYEIHMEKPT